MNRPQVPLDSFEIRVFELRVVGFVQIVFPINRVVHYVSSRVAAVLTVVLREANADNSFHLCVR